MFHNNFSRIYTYIINISDWPKRKKSFPNVFLIFCSRIYTYILNISDWPKKKKVFKKLFLNFLIPKNLKLQIFNLFRKIEIEFQKKFFNSIWSGNKMKKVLYIHLIGFIFWLPWTPLLKTSTTLRPLYRILKIKKVKKWPKKSKNGQKWRQIVKMSSALKFWWKFFTNVFFYSLKTFFGATLGCLRQPQLISS